ncbi:hypothetical protein R3P38DRAFT_2827884 [Favolaschia claudopus]|uniref:Uncharacterized protein n=1 Tax=Favolaschia claudopus TaxID=2862362 RepID=A0AAW0EM06_9AGAR
MADALILNNLHVAYNILLRNVARTLRRRADFTLGPDDMNQQIAEVVQFCAEASQRQGLLAPADFQVIQTSMRDLLQELGALLTPESVPSCSNAPALCPETPPVAMHRGLLVSDIVWTIVSQLDPRAVEGRKALAALARSKIFHHHALDVLWKTQMTVRNLMRCFPEDLWQSPSQSLRLARTPRATDWDRVLQYSVRIRHFRIYRSATKAIECLATMLRAGGLGEPFMPNLESLEWHTGSLENIDLFLGTQVTALSLGGLYPEDFAVIHSFDLSALTEVLITGNFYHRYSNAQGVNVADDLSTFVCGLRRVRTLHVGAGINNDAIIYLGRLPTLRSLFLTVSAGCMTLSLPAMALFHHLQSFEIKSDEERAIDYARALINSWDESPLQSFKMTFDSDVFPFLTTSTAEAFFRELSEHCSHPHLTSINIEFTSSSDTTEANLILGDAFKPLCCFTQLRTVVIYMTNNFALDDAAIADLAASWPQIEEFSISSRDAGPSSTTLSALYELARHCTKLRALCLCLDATTVPPPDPLTIHHPPLLHANLTKLNVSYSRIGDAFTVARFLSATFVNLDQLTTAMENQPIPNEIQAGEDPEFTEQVECHLVWKDVERYLPELREIRMEEFRRGQESIDQTAYFVPFETNLAT